MRQMRLVYVRTWCLFINKCILAKGQNPLYSTLVSLYLRRLVDKCMLLRNMKLIFEGSWCRFINKNSLTEGQAHENNKQNMNSQSHF